jgi:chromosome segregation ATPase
LQNDKTILEDIIEKGQNDKMVSEKYRLVKDCCEKYLEIINDKLVENIEQSMVLKINFKEILDLNLANNDRIRNLNNQLYNLEKTRIDLPGKSEETEVKLKLVKDEIRNIQNAIDENDKMKLKISESLQKNENNKKALKIILLKFMSRRQQNNDLEAAINSIQKEREELDKKNSYQEHLLNLAKDKDKKDPKLGEVLSEVDFLKKLLEEKEKKIKEISVRNNRQNEFITKENIIGNLI